MARSGLTALSVRMPRCDLARHLQVPGMAATQQACGNDRLQRQAQHRLKSKLDSERRPRDLREEYASNWMASHSRTRAEQAIDQASSSVECIERVGRAEVNGVESCSSKRILSPFYHCCCRRWTACYDFPGDYLCLWADEVAQALPRVDGRMA